MAGSQGQVGGGLNGTVKDVSGAVIPTGKVSLISEGDVVGTDR